MYLVGLTGGIATGKSTVSAVFARMGVPVIDADLMARRVVQPGRRALRRLQQTFGDEILLEDGTLNRAALANIIFEDSTKRQQVNRITHPEIFREICWEIVYNFFKGYKFVILDLPLLFESGMWESYLTSIIVVTCESDLQIQRLMQRNELSEADALARINAQMSLEDKCARATYVIENSGSFDDTDHQVAAIYDQLNNSRSYLKIRLSAMALVGIVVGGASFLIAWITKSIIS